MDSIKQISMSSEPNTENSEKNQNAAISYQFISNILDDQLDKNTSPQYLRVKNNILIIFLLFSAYGIFFLIGDFTNTLLTAYIAGIAYLQTRERFCKIVMTHQQNKNKKLFIVRFAKALLFLMLGFILPYLRYILGHPEQLQYPTYNEILFSFRNTRNMIVIGCEVIIGFKIIYLIFGDYLETLSLNFRPKNKFFVRGVFAFTILTITILTLIIVPSILFREVSSLGYSIQMKIQKKLQCQILAIDESSELPFCSEKITTQNLFIKQSIEEFKNQNQTIERCLEFIAQIQEDYAGQYLSSFEVQEYDEIICTWYSFFEKAGNYSGIGQSQQMRNMMMSGGANFFKTFFGSLAIFLSSFSNFIFSLTTFITMFYLTTQYFNESSGVIKHIFSERKQQLISSITNLIQATLFIAFQHFLMSVILLQMFSFTNLNLMLATLLSSMAFFPFFRPWFGVLIVTMIRMLILGEYTVSLLFLIIYYYQSEKIYSKHLKKLEIHEILTNMSVLFGIYRFGISGIFYGPLIIIIYKCVEKELLRNQRD